MTMQEFQQARIDALVKDNQNKDAEIEKLYKIIFELLCNNPTEDYKNFIIKELFSNDE